VQILTLLLLLLANAAMLKSPFAEELTKQIHNAGGARSWQVLHRAVYGVAGLALLHFFWMRAGKNDFADVAVYGAVLAVLLGWRVWRKWRPITS
jgi:sulfoxide reductase heme-binding subunit YedZ